VFIALRAAQRVIACCADQGHYQPLAASVALLRFNRRNQAARVSRAYEIADNRRIALRGALMGIRRDRLTDLPESLLLLVMVVSCNVSSRRLYLTPAFRS
jgi:hypothetical protein